MPATQELTDWLKSLNPGDEIAVVRGNRVQISKVCTHWSRNGIVTVGGLVFYRGDGVEVGSDSPDGPASIRPVTQADRDNEAKEKILARVRWVINHLRVNTSTVSLDSLLALEQTAKAVDPFQFEFN